MPIRHLETDIVCILSDFRKVTLHYTLIEVANNRSKPTVNVLIHDPIYNSEVNRSFTETSDIIRGS